MDQQAAVVHSTVDKYSRFEPAETWVVYHAFNVPSLLSSIYDDSQYHISH